MRNTNVANGVIK